MKVATYLKLFTFWSIRFWFVEVFFLRQRRTLKWADSVSYILVIHVVKAGIFKEHFHLTSLNILITYTLLIMLAVPIMFTLILLINYIICRCSLTYLFWKIWKFFTKTFVVETGKFSEKLFNKFNWIRHNIFISWLTLNILIYCLSNFPALANNTTESWQGKFTGDVVV